MTKANDLTRGDPCPACGGELKAARVPTDDEYRRAFDKENPIVLPPGTDTMSPTQRDELGELHRCFVCGYQTRFPTEAAPNDNGDASPDEKGDRAHDDRTKAARSGASRR